LDRRSRFRSRGRGGGYTPLRGGIEALLRVLYRGSWPAALWGRLPAARRVRRIERRLQVLSPGLRPLRLGFVSDLHLGPTTPWSVLETAFELLRQAAPDVLVLGGDFVFLEATPAKASALARLVASVPAPSKVAVLGNHDLWTRHELLEEALMAAGVELLVNRSVRLPAPHQAVAVLGLDDPWTGAPDAAAALSGAEDAATLLAVCHSPDGLLHLADRGVSLLLCGHTHGGQVATPWGPLVVSHGALTRRFGHGFFDLAGLTLFVSRGVGSIEVPLRLFAPPDVAVLDLVARAS
jgi:predicted MPP superfamily phosphohydrolase